MFSVNSRVVRTAKRTGVRVSFDFDEGGIVEDAIENNRIGVCRKDRSR